MMQVRITQRFAPAGDGVDLCSAGHQLREHAQSADALDLSRQTVADGRLLQVYEGFATAEADGGHKALHVRRYAEGLGLLIDGEAIEILEFPDQQAAAWTLGSG